MRRIGNLYQKILMPENFRLAFVKAAHGKRDRIEIIRFAHNMDRKIDSIIKRVKNETFDMSRYNTFEIRDPKKRTICAASFETRVLHHAVMNICDPVFERCQIYDSYASRRNKGTFAALNRAVAFSKNKKWFLKLDVRKFFDSIDHTILKAQLHRLFREEKLLRLMHRIIDSYEVYSDRGVPIGNLTSQYFANHYLCGLDHYIKENLKTGRYVRYMDDMVLWGDCKIEMIEKRDRVNEYLNEKLNQMFKPECLNQIEYGLPFLGFRIFKNRVLLRSGTRKRFVKKIKFLNKEVLNGRIQQSEYSGRMMAAIAHVEHSDCFNLRRSLTYV